MGNTSCCEARRVTNQHSKEIIPNSFINHNSSGAKFINITKKENSKTRVSREIPSHNEKKKLNFLEESKKPKKGRSNSPHKMQKALNSTRNAKNTLKPHKTTGWHKNTEEEKADSQFNFEEKEIQRILKKLGKKKSSKASPKRSPSKSPLGSSSKEKAKKPKTQTSTFPFKPEKHKSTGNVKTKIAARNVRSKKSATLFSAMNDTYSLQSQTALKNKGYAFTIHY
jgi:hypothetical protein